MSKPKPDEAVAALRAARDAILTQIDAMQIKARDLSKKIREAEGPIPDRSGRDRGAGYTIKPAAKK